MSTKITIEHCGMAGTGRTITEAKQDAARKIGKALAGSYTPWLASVDGETLLVFRDTAGWHYQVLAGGEEPRFCHGSCVEDGKTFDEAREAGCFHLAQGRDSIPDVLMRYLSPAKARQLTAYHAWQRAYRQAKAEGLSDEQARGRANAAERVFRAALDALCRTA